MHGINNTDVYVTCAGKDRFNLAAAAFKKPCKYGAIAHWEQQLEIIKTKTRLSKYSRAVAHAPVLRQHACFCHQLKVVTPDTGRRDDFIREISVDVETSH